MRNLHAGRATASSLRLPMPETLNAAPSTRNPKSLIRCHSWRAASLALDCDPRGRGGSRSNRRPGTVQRDPGTDIASLGFNPHDLGSQTQRLGKTAALSPCKRAMDRSLGVLLTGMKRISSLRAHKRSPKDSQSYKATASSSPSCSPRSP